MHLAGRSITAALAVALAACGAGPEGPAGPAGEKGEPGIAGPRGEIGLTPNVPPPFKRALDARIGGWAGSNESRINDMLKDYGVASSSFDPARRPVAVMDWDNTMIKNDIGDATMFWMIKNSKILQPANKNWSTTNANLTTAALAALNAACDTLANPGEPLPTATNTACADAIVHIYYNAKTPAGASAWNNEVTLTMNQPYAWVSQLQSGYTPDEVRAMATAAWEENSEAPLGHVQTVGTLGNLNAYVRLYDQMNDLVDALQANGFDVWVLTASPQYVVDAISHHVGIPRDHVIGIRPVLSGGKVTANLQGCGTVQDSTNTLITYDQGKRCFINKIIFREPAASQLAKNPDVTKRPVFVAGDSDTDLAMIQDATVLKLAIDRNKVMLMCNAFANYQAKWLVQPMFISPRAKKTTPYPCSTTYDKGEPPALIKDEAGNPIADQTEP